MSKKKKKEFQTEPPWLRISIGMALLILITFSLIAYVQYGIVNNYIASNKEASDSAFGLSGDFFGLSNAVFSALAFAMIIVTLWMQKYELKQQREELELTRIVFIQQQGELEQQNASLRRQTFENTFFGMLRLHSEIVSAITTQRGNTVKKGREAFEFLITSLKLDSQTEERQGKTKVKREVVTEESYENWYRKHEDEVGHYFRTLYNLVRYIHENGEGQRVMYARLVRAQLSSNELQLLLYNGLCKHGREKFKPLMEKYALLKHLRESTELNSWRSQYDRSVFGRKETE